MKNNRGSAVLIVMLILVLVSVGIGAFYLTKKPISVTNGNTSPTSLPTALPQNTTGPQSEALSDKNCHDFPQYFVVEGEIPDSVGINLLIKYKTSPEQKFPCTYSKDTNDFEIKNQFAEYYWGITDHFLILDSGTGPDPRGLIVYDLSTRKQVFEDQYSHPATIGNGTVDYWTPTKTKATKSNCSESTEYNSAGLGAIIESHVSLELTTLTKKDLGQTRCSPTQ